MKKLSPHKAELVLKGFANRRRLLILQNLKMKKEMSVTEIAEAINLSFRATSQHLRVLFLAGLVGKRHESTTVYYSLSGSYPQLQKTVFDLLE